MKKIREKVYNFKTKNKEGFVQSEIDTLLKDYPNINIDKFNSALRGITCFKKRNMETGIRKTIDGYQVWFKIDNQTFHLDEHVEETDKDSLEVAKFFERMLKVAFEKIDINVVSKKKLTF